jgi:hypothetical protein
MLAAPDPLSATAMEPVPLELAAVPGQRRP